MGKYEPLGDYLRTQSAPYVTLSFDGVEHIVGDTLPVSARTRTSWWANDASADRVEVRAWMNAGWKVDSVSLSHERVWFVRV